MSRFSLTSAELAVLINHMTGGRLLQESTTQPELRIDAPALGAAEEDLLERGLLVSLPFEEASGVSSQLASILSAAITPDRVCILRTIHRDHTDPPVIFSFAAEGITRNQVDAQGQHTFVELADREEALRAILAAGGADAAPKRRGKSNACPLADLLERAERLVMLIVVDDPAEPEASALSLSWIQTDEGLWLVDASSDRDAPLAQPIAVAGLRERIAAALNAEG